MGDLLLYDRKNMRENFIGKYISAVGIFAGVGAMIAGVVVGFRSEENIMNLPVEEARNAAEYLLNGGAVLTILSSQGFVYFTKKIQRELDMWLKIITQEVESDRKIISNYEEIFGELTDEEEGYFGRKRGRILHLERALKNW